MEEVLLPSDVRPIRYEIALSPDLVACTFSGSLSLTVSLSAPRAAITLHCHPSLAVKDASFVGADGKAVKAVSYLYTTATETLVIAFPALLTSGGTLGCKFAGVLNDEMAGFYRSKYMLRGESRWAAVTQVGSRMHARHSSASSSPSHCSPPPSPPNTQFEATDARRCFPCIDEPSAKAVFGITVTAPADRTVLSGMSATRVTTSADGKSKTYTFADTPPQSTYLVAVCVGEWDAVSAVDPVSLVRTSVYTPVGRAASGEFALKVGVEALAYLTAIFGHPYMGGSKVDHIAIADFAAGAMENTGLITYREAALLIDEHSSMAMKQRVAQVVSQ
jgi:puromycin-sensitive aminopeptidase